jgi:pyroglutamyl-peptidase
MSRQPVLLTGFGPFPGAPENVSKWLVEALPDTIPSSRLGCDLHGTVLPTEWAEVSRRGPELLDRHKPRLVLHFGLNRRARGFRIEQFAHNRVEARPDARGALPKGGCILERGRARLDTPVPARKLTEHLQQSGLPAARSRSAGGYLCNFLYYHSLHWAAAREERCHVCFVHLPPGPKEGGPMTEAELLRGAETVLLYLLETVDRGNGTAPLLAARGAARP